MSVESVNIKIEDDLETMSAVQSITAAGIKQTMRWLEEPVGSVALVGLGYFPKGIFPRATSQATISQVATFQICNFPSGSFPNVHLRLGYDFCGDAGCQGAERRGFILLGSFHLVKYPWKVATSKIAHWGSCHLSSCPFVFY